MTRIGRQWLCGALLSATLSWAAPRPAAACAGDCDADGAVGVAELITGVRITLGEIELSACPRFDTNVDGQLGISELVEAVGLALGGCPAAPSATATAAPVPTDTPEPTATAEPIETATATPTLPPVAGLWTEAPLAVTASTCPSNVTDPFAEQLASFPPCDQTVGLVSETAVTIEDCTGTRVDGSLARDGTIAFAYEPVLGSDGPCEVELTPSAMVAAGSSPTTAAYSFAIGFSGDGCDREDCRIDASGTWTKQ